jgi:hypothetical protein
MRYDTLAGLERAELTTAERSVVASRIGFGGPVVVNGPDGTSRGVLALPRRINFANIGPEIVAKYRETANLRDAYGNSVQTVLGMPLSDEQPALNGGRVVHYQGGAIYYSPQTGAHAVIGLIVQKYMTMQSTLGLPTSDELSAVNGGRVSHFQHGSIYWSQSTKARAVYGAVAAELARTTQDRDGTPVQQVLGLPTGDRMLTSRGYAQHFQGGSIYVDPILGARAVYGAIDARYRTLGAMDSRLGVPWTTETALENGGRMVQFAYGTIVWMPGVGAIESFSGASLNNGVLSIEGSNGDDDIVIVNEGGFVTVRGAAIVTTTQNLVRGFTINSYAKVPAAWVTRIEVRAWDGRDYVEMREGPGSKTIPMRIDGGAGNDRGLSAAPARTAPMAVRVRTSSSANRSPRISIPSVTPWTR